MIGRRQGIAERQRGQPFGPAAEERIAANYESTCSQFGQARELTRRAVDSAQRAQEKEAAAEYEGHNSVREGLVGLMDFAKEDAQSALATVKGKHGEGFSAIAFALAGDVANANRAIDDLTKRFPQNTVVQTRYLPMARSALALNSGNAQVAVEVLAAAAPYELGHTNEDFTFALYPIYFRGQAYLAARQGPEAAAEFQKILDHRAIVVSDPIGALARLQLGRAFALSGDRTKAKAAYQDFLTLWKDADPDIPILKQAKAEYGKLQ